MFKMVGICWRVQVYIVRQQWQKLGNSPITRPRNITEQHSTAVTSILQLPSIDPIHAANAWNQASFSWIERHTEGDGTMMLRHRNVK